MTTAGPLFGTSSGLGGSSGGNKHLVEFRAGRMTLKGRMVHPDKRKGLLYVYQGEDSLMHFCWKDRSTGEVEDDLLIFPDDCEFVRVAQCTTGRVYMLKFKSFTRKYFFWMQEPKSDKDEEYCRRINEVLNNPPAAGSGRSGSGGSNHPDGELQSLLNKMSQQQLMQLFGGVGGVGGLSSLLGTMGGSSSGARLTTNTGGGASSRTTSNTTTPTSRNNVDNVTRPRVTRSDSNSSNSANTTTAATTAANPTGQVFLSDLQRYFSNLGTTPESTTGGNNDNEATASELAQALASTEVVTTASAAAERLTQHLPTVPPANQPDDMRTTLLSPQFAQAVSLFSNALTSGQLAPVISQFGLGSDAVAAATTGDLQQFFRALETETNNDDNKESAEKKDDKPKDDSSKDDKSKPDKDGDEAMALD